MSDVVLYVDDTKFLLQPYATNITSHKTNSKLENTPMNLAGYSFD